MSESPHPGTGPHYSVPVETMKRVLFTEAGEVVSGYETHFAYCPKSKEFRPRKEYGAQ